MNKIKTVKIKEEDGSISEESYTIAADAINIDMENGKNLQETVGNIDVDNDGNIETQLKNKINKIDIVDNLNSTENNKVLSAKQGKVLGDKLNKKPYYYNNIENMKMANLNIGDFVFVSGYYESNDNGQGKYIIVENDINNEYCIKLNNNKYAKLIIENSIKPEQLGIKHNEETNLMTLVSKIANNHKVPIELSNKTYLINEYIPLFTGIEIIGNNGTIKSTLNIPILFANSPIYKINIHDLNISASTNSEHTSADGISVPCYYSKFNNITISGGYKSINITTTGASGTLVENYFSNIICRAPRYCGLYLGALDNNKITDGFLNNIIVNGSSGCSYGVLIGSSAGWNINGCHFYGNISKPLSLYNAFYTDISNIYIEKALNRAIDCGRVQTALNLHNLLIHQTNDDDDCIHIERSSYQPTDNSDVNISNVTIIRNESFTSKIINCISLNARVVNINLNANSQNPRNFTNGCIHYITGAARENYIVVSDNKTNLGRCLITKRVNISGTTKLEISIPEFSNYTQSLLRLKCFGAVYYDQTGKYYSADIYFVRKDSTPVIKKFNEVNSMFSSINYTLDINNKKIIIEYTFDASNVNAIAEYQIDS